MSRVKRLLLRVFPRWFYRPRHAWAEPESVDTWLWPEEAE